MLNMVPKKLILPLALLAFFPQCKNRQITRKRVAAHKQRKQQTVEPTMTVWIHGTTFNEFLGQFHAAPRGLHKAQNLPDSSIPLAPLPKRQAQLLSQLDPQRFPYEWFYVFGWSGELDFEVREQEAGNLYECLKKEIAALEKEHGKKPKIRIITHSHGGNVALNLVKTANQFQDNEFVIDELILIACPVQRATSKFISDPMFKKVYSLYSATDLMQVADPQGMYSYEHTKRKRGERRRPLFSERTFEPHCNLVQAQVRFNRRSLFHTDFIFKDGMSALPALLNELDVEFEQLKIGAITPEQAHYLLRVVS